MKDIAIAITANRFPYAFAALGMDDRQRDIFAAKIAYQGTDYSSRQALYLASRIIGAFVHQGAHR